MALNLRALGESGAAAGRKQSRRDVRTPSLQFELLLNRDCRALDLNSRKI